jgi:hypothetical protein
LWTATLTLWRCDLDAVVILKRLTAVSGNNPPPVLTPQTGEFSL